MLKKLCDTLSLTLDLIKNVLFFISMYGHGKLDLKFLFRQCRNRVAKYLNLREWKAPRLTEMCIH